MPEGKTGSEKTLEKERETLLVTLYCKAMESRKPRPLIVDEKAVELVQRLDYDYAGLRIPPKTQVMVCLRAKQMDDRVLHFLAESPEGTVVNLGCGLDSRSDRLDNGTARWYDLDYPEVIELRRRFYTETERKKMIASPVTAPDWLDAVAGRQGRHLFVAEGLLMYLREEEVRELLLRLRRRLPGSRLLADANRLDGSPAARCPARRAILDGGGSSVLGPAGVSRQPYPQGTILTVGRGLRPRPGPQRKGGVRCLPQRRLHRQPRRPPGRRPYNRPY